MLTAADIARVRTSFALVKTIQDTAAEMLYDRLFEVAPQLRALFPENMTEQKRKLMAMMAVAVDGLGDLDRLVPAVKALGARHASYGVTTEHYAIVKDVLLWTLERGLGDVFTPELNSAWNKVYDVLAAAMQAGGAEAKSLRAAE